MKMRELGPELSLKVRTIIADALKDWPPREGKRVRIKDVSQDMLTDEAGTIVARIQTYRRDHWRVRIKQRSLVEAVPC